MAHLLHPNAKTTPRVRKEIQQSQKRIAKLAKRYGINEKTVLKWKHADTVEDRKSGPPKRSGSVLTELDGQVICFVHKQLRLPLDDRYIILKPDIPKLTRSNLHRCLQYHGLSRLPKEDDEGKVKHEVCFHEVMINDVSELFYKEAVVLCSHPDTFFTAGEVWFQK